MGVKFRIVVYAPNQEAARKGILRAVERISDLEMICSDYDPGSELSRICKNAQPGKPQKISSELFELLKLSGEVNKQSNGSFDPTLGLLSKTWRVARKAKRIPAEKEILANLQKTGWGNLELGSENDSTVTFKKAGIQLDLGGIAKGFAADEAIRILKEQGMSSCLVDAGGDVTVGDAPPGKPGWTIAVSDQAGKRISIENGSVATSGDRFQFLEHKGVRYSHILDPKTGWGMTERRLVTVVCKSEKRAGTLADAWASAASIMPVRSLRESWDQLGLAGIQLVDPENEKAPLLELGLLVD